MPFLAGVMGACLVGGILLVIAGLVPVPDEGKPPRRAPRRGSVLGRLLGENLPAAQRDRRRIWLAVGFGGGVVAWLVTGWFLAVVLLPIMVVGVPTLLRPPASGTDVERLTSIEQWVRGLSGVLTVGSGIEHAITASMASTPAPILPMVSTLVARLNARWPTEAALRAFADDLDDATGDLVAAALILGAHRRGPGLAAVLDDLAVTVAEEVRMRRGVEADRAKPRTTARWVTILTLGVLGLLALNGDYIAPYKTPLGQLVLLALLCLYLGCLLWMRAMTRGAPTPRFLPSPTKQNVGVAQ